ncbi:hypothetical protein NMY22_g1613 [Coprinellus aureogranulatus]|nr:hypothetical protein NMY22_g1613 [Coprinellus aureogranulatus]
MAPTKGSSVRASGGLQFVFGTYDSDSGFQGSDGRRQSHRQSPPEVSMSPSPHSDHPIVTKSSGRPPKRRRSNEDEEDDEPAPKRRPGRPRKDADAGGAIIEFGGFIVPASGINKTASLPRNLGLSDKPSNPAGVRRTISLPTQSTLRPEPPTNPATPHSEDLSPPRLPNYDDNDGLDDEIQEREPSSSAGSREAEADGSGVGHDDGEDDEDQDEDDPLSRDVQDPETPSPNRTPLPERFEVEFKAKVKECRERDSMGRPPLYSKLRMFFWPKADPFFILESSSSPVPDDVLEPTFCLWDPLSLAEFQSIRCPNDCGGSLKRHSHIRRPRRIVSLNSTYWIIGFRYYCSTCHSLKRPGKQASWQSWNSQVLARLDERIAARFPATLTHRSGIDNSTLDLMRATFQQGVGSAQFSDILRQLHLLDYDRLQLLYLMDVHSRLIHHWVGVTYHPFPIFNDRSARRPHGFVPSGTWLRSVYDRHIDNHRDYFNRHLALLSGRIRAALGRVALVPFLILDVRRDGLAPRGIGHYNTTTWGFERRKARARLGTSGLLRASHASGAAIAYFAHTSVQLYTLDTPSKSVVTASRRSLGSHKFTKFIMRVNGQLVFTALLTVTNERGEIRVCCLVATKSHAQFESAFGRCATHWTGDRQFLMNIFPSLSVGVSPREKYDHLPPFSIPPSTAISVRDTVGSINTAMQAIMNDLDEDGASSLVVGFDCEWNVHFGPGERVVGRGSVAVVQIAYQSTVYILRVAKILRNGALPHQLELLLVNSRIKKVGIKVNGDLIALRKACNSTKPFAGAVELPKYARERCLLESRMNEPGIGLNDICALVLGKSLAKNVPERMSEAWDRPTLTDKQIGYAACDAWAALCIYQRLASIPVPTPLPSNPAQRQPAPGTPVLIYGEDNGIIARGVTASQEAEIAFHHVPLRSQVIVNIRHIVVPGAVLLSHGKKPLSAFGKVPFNAVVARSRVRIYQPIILPNIEAPANNDVLGVGRGAQSSTPQGRAELDGETSHAGDTEPSLADLIFDTVDVSKIVAGSNQTWDNSEVDKEALIEGLAILGSIPKIWDLKWFSRVLKDPFHVLNMLRIAASHGLRLEFARALRDAIFIYVLEDVQRISAWGLSQNPPLSFDYLLKHRTQWVLHRCRRIIPPPAQLGPAVEAVFRKYGGLKDAATGTPLFTQNHWKAAKNILKLIHDGHLSDPPGVALYTQMGVGKKTGLPIYRCFRGTNATEGGVHTHLRSHLPSAGTSIEHAQALLMDYVLHHNLRTNHKNSTGKPYPGHTHIWITNKIQRLTLALHGTGLLSGPPQPAIPTNWLNTDFYEPAHEVIGVHPIPTDIKNACGILSYFPTIPGTPAIRSPNKQYAFLAKLQGTRKAVLPVHTKREYQLFDQLLKHDPAFSTIQGAHPNWDEAVKVYNGYAEREEDVFYKLTDQLQSHWTEYKATVNRKETASITYDDRQGLQTALRSNERAIGAPSIEAEPMHPHFVHQGFLTPHPTHTEVHDAVENVGPQQTSQYEDPDSPPCIVEPSQSPQPCAAASTDVGRLSQQGSSTSEMSLDIASEPRPASHSLVRMTELSHQYVNETITQPASAAPAEALGDRSLRRHQVHQGGHRRLDYPNESNAWDGLLRSALLVKAYKHVFTSPSSVHGTTVNKATRSCNARIHGMTSVTIASIAYIATQVRFALNDAASFCRSAHAGTDSEYFYNLIIDLLEDEKEAVEVADLLKWWNQQIFPTQVTHARTVDGDSVIAKIKERRRLIDAGLWSMSQGDGDLATQDSTPVTQAASSSV